MSFIYQDPWDRERTCIKEKLKSQSKYTCSEIPYDPVEMTALMSKPIALFLKNDYFGQFELNKFFRLA